MLSKFFTLENLVKWGAVILTALFIHYLVEFSSHSNTFPVMSNIEDLITSERFVLKEEFMFDANLGIPGRIYIDTTTNKEVLYIWALGPALVNLDNKTNVHVIIPRAKKRHMK